MESRTEAGSLWLTRPTDIAVHLACAAADKRPVTLTAAGVNAQGVFSPPDRSGPMFVPDPRGPLSMPRVGATVKAEYFARTDAFSFFSRLVSVDANGRWVLQSPLAVERCDRRLTARHIVVGVSGFCFRLSSVPGQPLLGLYDIAEAGAAFVADPRRHTFHFEEHVQGTIHMPGESPLSVTLEVRHSRDFPRQNNLRIYGTRFVDMAPAAEATLKEFLAHWGGGRPR
ncbi:hypothetical protein LBMAG42_15490 [Deltaproteobacteria bacterium]|nr:hypothetical protein LBMAG42_15490 [Deltaproteobacteria bacterium]